MMMPAGAQARARPEEEAAPLPLVAVVMSVYAGDRLDFFQAAVESLQRQSYPAGRLRLYLGVDGPLAEDLEAWIGEQSGRFHRIVRLERNQGLHAILNQLLDALTDEELVARMDADDLSAPGRIAAQVSFLLSHPEVDVVGCAIEEIDEQEQTLFTRVYPRGGTDLRPYMCRTVPVGHATACVRRRVFEQIRYTGRFGRNEDVALWFDCVAAGMQLANLPQPLYRQRVTHEALRRRKGTYIWDEFRAFSYGVHRCFGFSWRQAYPAARLLFRLAPVGAMRAIYRRGLGRNLPSAASTDAVASGREQARAAYRRHTGPQAHSRHDLIHNPEVLFQVLAGDAGRIRALRAMELDPATCRWLDVGCGRGESMLAWLRLGLSPANACGIEVRPEAMQPRVPALAAAHLLCADAAALPFPNQAFDLVMESTMFTQMPDDGLAGRIAAEMLRITRPGGYLVLCDWRYGKPGDPVYVGLSGKRIRKLFLHSGQAVRVASFPGSLVPPVGRRLSRYLPAAYFPVASLVRPLVGLYFTVLRAHPQSGARGAA